MQRISRCQYYDKAFKQMDPFDRAYAAIQEHGICARSSKSELWSLYKLTKLACKYEFPLIIELGTFAGASSIIMAQALKHCNRGGKILSVDNGSEIDLDVTKANLEKSGFSSRIDLIESGDNEYLISCIPDTIDLIYIDSRHTYNHVSETLEIVTQKVRAGGIIAGHDYCPVEPGVVRAVEEWKFRCKDYLVGWALDESFWWTMKRWW